MKLEILNKGKYRKSLVGGKTSSGERLSQYQFNLFKTWRCLASSLDLIEFENYFEKLEYSNEWIILIQHILEVQYYNNLPLLTLMENTKALLQKLIDTGSLEEESKLYEPQFLRLQQLKEDKLKKQDISPQTAEILNKACCLQTLEVCEHLNTPLIAVNNPHMVLHLLSDYTFKTQLDGVMKVFFTNLGKDVPTDKFVPYHSREERKVLNGLVSYYHNNFSQPNFFVNKLIEELNLSGNYTLSNYKKLLYYCIATLEIAETYPELNTDTDTILHDFYSLIDTSYFDLPLLFYTLSGVNLTVMRTLNISAEELKQMNNDLPLLNIKTQIYDSNMEYRYYL